MEIIINEIGSNGFFQLRNQLEEIVRDHFYTLYEGACRLGMNIEEDYYAPRRVQINKTRLHKHTGLKYAAGHRYDDPVAPTTEQLLDTVRDIQQLFDEAAKTIPAPFRIVLVKDHEEERK